MAKVLRQRNIFLLVRISHNPVKIDLEYRLLLGGLLNGKRELR